jgi:hypothetical protein
VKKPRTPIPVTDRSFGLARDTVKIR